MRNIILLLALLSMASCSRRSPRSESTALDGYTVERRIPTTPVKHQGTSTLCWLYAMLATIESEHLAQGDSVNLSPHYIARRMLEAQAERYYFSRRPSDLALRGTASIALRALQTYGAQPYDTYSTRRPVAYGVLTRRVQQVVRTAGSLGQMKGRLEQLLDDEIGFTPRYVFMLGAEYTPREFAHSVCLPSEYVALTSFSHHPFGRRFALEVPDNTPRDSFLNVPLDRLMQAVEQALSHGHPVCWEGDISEPGFDHKRGVATLPAYLPEVTQQQRQRAYETRRTTDDHAMELCGLVRDRQGRRYFLAKNSWGTDNALGGYMLLSYNYVRLKTIAVWMSRKAWGWSVSR